MTLQEKLKANAIKKRLDQLFSEEGYELLDSTTAKPNFQSINDLKADAAFSNRSISEVVNYLTTKLKSPAEYHLFLSSSEVYSGKWIRIASIELDKVLQRLDDSTDTFEFVISDQQAHIMVIEEEDEYKVFDWTST